MNNILIFLFNIWYINIYYTCIHIEMSEENALYLKFFIKHSRCASKISVL